MAYEARNALREEMKLRESSLQSSKRINGEARETVAEN